MIRQAGRHGKNRSRRIHSTERTTVLRGTLPRRRVPNDLSERASWTLPECTAKILPSTLSVFRGDAVSSTVVVLRNPRLVGNDLSYEVRVLEGTLPSQSGPCSLFIDIIGMPLTPFSYAGAARRAWRRGVYAPVAVAPAVYYPPPVAYYGPSVVHYGYPVVRPAVV
jgi:hypothetical protein